MSGPSPKITPIHALPKHCSQCGVALEKKYIEEESRVRDTCPACGFIAYVNPLIVAGAIPSQNGKILLLKRGIEPRKGTWTFPAGFVELGESVAEGAIRETREETGMDIRVGAVLGVYSYPDNSVATVVYLAEVTGGALTVCPESMELAFFSKDEIPWDALSFRSTGEALKDWAAR